MAEAKQVTLTEAVEELNASLSRIHAQLFAVVDNDKKQLLERQLEAERVMRQLLAISPLMGRISGVIEDAERVVARLASNTAEELRRQDGTISAMETARAYGEHVVSPSSRPS